MTRLSTSGALDTNAEDTLNKLNEITAALHGRHCQLRFRAKPRKTYLRGTMQVHYLLRIAAVTLRNFSEHSTKSTRVDCTLMIFCLIII
jgi:hypothetical protein